VDDVMNRLKRQAAKNAAGQAALQQLVIAAHGEGKSLREIAKAAKMTPEGVRKMLLRIAPKQVADRELNELQRSLDELRDEA
jgi:predicted AAA+ superfamily ATPase